MASLNVQPSSGVRFRVIHKHRRVFIARRVLFRCLAGRGRGASLAYSLVRLPVLFLAFCRAVLYELAPRTHLCRAFLAAPAMHARGM